MYVAPRIAAKFYGVSVITLRRWANAGKIRTTRTRGDHRRFFIEDKPKEEKCSIIYARVSSNKQKPNLKHQIKALKEAYPDHTLITDIGSGINFKRKGFKQILDRLFCNTLKEVVVSSKDRFARFGFELFEDIFIRFGATIRAIDSKEDKSPTEELAEDLIAITTVFTARYHGRRRYNCVPKIKNIPKSKTKKIL